MLTVHHIVSDGWLLWVMACELSLLYVAYVRGEESPLQELAVQYADYARWQREWLSGEELAVQVRYWREALSGAPSRLELPTDRVRPREQSFRGVKRGLYLSAELTGRLRELSRREGVTLFMTLLCGFDVLLSRWSGEEEVVVAVPIANRRRSELEGMIGFFVNTLAMRTRVGGESRLREVLGRVREVALGAYGHQDLPF